MAALLIKLLQQVLGLNTIWHDNQQQMSMHDLQTHRLSAMLCFAAPAPPCSQADEANGSFLKQCFLPPFILLFCNEKFLIA